MEDLWRKYDLNELPGTILAPKEAFIARSCWLDECISDSTVEQRKFAYFGDPALRNVPRPCFDHLEVFQDILSSYMLFGKIDAMSGTFLHRKYLSNHGVIATWSEIFEEFFVADINPFAHDTHSRSMSSRSGPYEISVEQKPLLIKSILDTWRGVGFSLNSEAESNVERFIDSLSRNGALNQGSDAGNILHSLTSVIQRAVDLEKPLFSQEMAAPYWKQETKVKESAFILKITIDELSWLPQPQSFKQANKFIQNENIDELRRFIGLIQHHASVGSYQDIRDMKGEIHKNISSFANKSWSSKVAGLTTYIAVPVGVAELLLGSTALGISITGIGAASQFVSDLIQKRKNGHWLSLDDSSIKRGKKDK